MPDSLITRRDKSTFVLLSAPTGLTRTYRWTPSHARQIYEWRGEIRLTDAHVSMRDRHDYYSLLMLLFDIIEVSFQYLFALDGLRDSSSIAVNTE